MRPLLSFIGHLPGNTVSAIGSAFRFAFGHIGFRKIAAEFFVEVGVLWFVFPILDTIVQFGSSKVTAKLAFSSIVVAALCMSIAGILSNDRNAEVEP